jgi:8-oxo-dGTP pyrophosphatase MutT (NUDIX family)
MGYIEEMRALVGRRPLLLGGAAVILLDPSGRLLLMRRADTGEWDVLGGTVEPGETLEDTAHRELREELGLAVRELTLFRVLSGPEFYVTFPNGDEVYYVGAAYLGRGLVGEVRPDPDEVMEWCYFDAFALPAPLAPCGAVILRWYVASLARG